jgi:Arc/MetJ family transcription regulator
MRIRPPGGNGVRVLGVPPDRGVVYGRCTGRINVDNGGAVVAVVTERRRLKTKGEAVYLALRRLAGEAMTRQEALAIEGPEGLNPFAFPADEIVVSGVSADPFEDERRTSLDRSAGTSTRSTPNSSWVAMGTSWNGSTSSKPIVRSASVE